MALAFRPHVRRFSRFVVQSIDWQNTVETEQEFVENTGFRRPNVLDSTLVPADSLGSGASPAGHFCTIGSTPYCLFLRSRSWRAIMDPWTFVDSLRSARRARASCKDFFLPAGLFCTAPFLALCKTSRCWGSLWGCER